MTDGKPLATITGQSEVTDRGADGSLQAGYRVSFQTQKGMVGTVFVQRAGYNRDAVLAAVKEQAAILDAVQGSEVH